jgi:acyl-CoA thioesterase-1
LHTQEDLEKYQALLHSFDNVKKLRSELIAYDFAQTTEDPALPRVYIIGDSISISYTPVVRKCLEGKANVLRPPCNCKTTKFGLRHLDRWLDIGELDLCLVNFGIHDILLDRKVELPDHRENIKRIIEIVSAKCPMMWVTTTDFKGPPKLRPNADQEAHGIYRREARKVVEETGCSIIDLDPLVAKAEKNLHMQKDGMHFSDLGYDILGEFIAKTVEEQLNKQRRLFL